MAWRWGKALQGKCRRESWSQRSQKRAGQKGGEKLSGGGREELFGTVVEGEEDLREKQEGRVEF